MLLVVLAALLLIGFAVVLLLRAATLGRARTVQTLDTIEAYGFETTTAAQSPAQSTGPITNLATTLGDVAARNVRGLREDDLQRRLVAAGLYSVGPRRFIGYQVLTAVLAPLLLVWLLELVGATGPLLVLVGLVGIVIGWILPLTYLTHRAGKRLHTIERRLPELIDLLVVTLEAGLGFTASLNVAAARLEGPLGDEVRLTLQEQNFGLSILDALENLRQRCDTPSIRAFTRAIVQGERLGVSIGQIMRNLAVEMRKRRRAAAEERAQKAPIKMLFPLAFLIFPAMFLILLGPALYTLSDTFLGK